MFRLHGLLFGLVSIISATAGGTAHAADVFQPMDTYQRVDTFRDRFEFRFGVGMHGVGSVESGTVSLNPEIVFPQLRLGDWPIDPRWAFLIPRLHIGGMANLSGRTSYGYAGALWTLGVTERLFVEGFLGGALHDGSLTGNAAANQAALGCRLLFHVGGSVGYRITQQWSVMFTFDHLSNGNAVLDGCSRNQGLNEYLLRVGYSF
jgi:lipid A 3-O-deacylase